MLLTVSKAKDGFIPTPASWVFNPKKPGDVIDTGCSGLFGIRPRPS